tara:strand:- start:2930 stop:3349 length:420 start_codon:yes stop_codon:yes gene_type:complete
MENKLTTQQIRDILGNKRFNMSGYDDYSERSNRNGSRGGCVLNNQNVLNTFASHGIYEHTEYLYLDFYKGSPTLHFKYWNEDLGRNVIIDDSVPFRTIYGSMGRIDDNMPGWTTSEIILRVLELTIYSGKPKRRVREND